MKISDHFTNDFFRADNFDVKGVVLTIGSVEMDKVGSDDKMIVHFIDTEKQLPLNKTNALDIAQLYGDDTDDWIGKQIRLYRDKVMFNNKRVDCMRVSAPMPGIPTGWTRESHSPTA